MARVSSDDRIRLRLKSPDRYRGRRMQEIASALKQVAIMATRMLLAQMVRSEVSRLSAKAKTDRQSSRAPTRRREWA